jgi:crossover junction endodeoxyribonuclease RuvC
VRILGLDPGTARLGYGALDERGGRVEAVAYGVLETARAPLPDRLAELFDGLERLVRDLAPSVAVVEQLFFGQNARSALQVGHARGVILLALKRGGVPVLEVTPAQVKQAIAGWGGADKRQVQDMVARVLRLSEAPQPDDAADALAIAWCGLGPARLRERRP